jgi:hypothetical protein
MPSRRPWRRWTAIPSKPRRLSKVRLAWFSGNTRLTGLWNSAAALRLDEGGEHRLANPAATVIPSDVYRELGNFALAAPGKT